MTRIRHALTAIILTAATAVTQAAELLPRIFYSAPERAAIIAMRRPAAAASEAAATPSTAMATAAAATPPAASTTQRLDGISIAQGGQTFAWFSGRRYGNGSLLGSSRLQITREGVHLTGADGRRRIIRVGETLGRAP